MGLYDAVHGGDRCGQTKALGKGLRDLFAGDAVEVVPAPMTSEAFDRYIDGTSQPVADTANVSAGVADRWVVVRQGIVVGWSDDGDPGLPYYDYLGRLLPVRPVPDELARRRQPDADEPGDCEACLAVREARVVEWRAARRRACFRAR